MNETIKYRTSIIRRKSPLLYLLVAFIVLFSGGLFTYSLFPFWMVVALPFAILYIISHRAYPNSYEMLFMLATVLLLCLQCIKFHSSFIPAIRPISLLVVMYVGSRLLRSSFVKVFIDVIYFFAAVSLVFWIIDILGGRNLLLSISGALPQLGASFFFDENQMRGINTLYFYSIVDGSSIYENYIRNSGPFWEPGRFAIFLNFALALNVFRDRAKIFTFRNIILGLAVVSTFSTSGYIALLCILVGIVLCSSNSALSKIVLFILIVVPSAFIITNLDFMQDKVMLQMSEIDVESSRFGAMAYHWLQIRESPLIGFGPFLVSVFGESLFVSPNGWTDLVRYFGFPMAAVMFTALFFTVPSIMNISKNAAVKKTIIFLVLIIVAFSQTVMYSPFYYLLYFFALNDVKSVKGNNKYLNQNVNK